MNKHTIFLEEPVTLGPDVTKTHCTDFKSNPLPLGVAGRGIVTVSFTRPPEADANIVLGIQASPNGGDLWTTAMFFSFTIPLNTPADENNQVRISIPISMYGLSHLRLAEIKNEDKKITITGINACLSI